MPSLRAQLAHWLVYYKFYASRHATEPQLLSNIRDSYTSEDVAQPPPTDVSSNEAIEVVREEKGLVAGQKWTVDHISNTDASGSGKVLVYWHGGAFIRGTTPHHWQFLSTLVSSTGIPAVLPHYTLAPLSTASHATLAGLQLLLDLDTDPRYSGKEIVLMGDSAGGWFVGQLLVCLTKLALGEPLDLPGEADVTSQYDLETLKRVRERVKKAVLISPALEMDMGSTDHPEDAEIQSADSWLNYQCTLIFGRLWALGPTSTSSVDYDLPASASTVSHAQYTLPGTTDLVVESVNPTRAIGVLRRYTKEHGGAGVKVLQMCGTADILHPQALRLDETLRGLGSDVVKPELIVEPGLFHVYPLIQFTPEAQKAITRIKALMLEGDD